MRGAPKTIELTGTDLGHGELPAIAAGEVRLALGAEARGRIERSRAVVERALTEGRTVYGINTGFGHLKNKRIEAGDLERLQLNLVRSHAAGVGEPLAASIVRLALAFRANTLARGQSGVRAELVERLLDLYNHAVIPWIPSQGSVGASGDLAPLAHMALVLIGEGQAYVDGELLAGGDALARRGLRPLRLAAKEGLALVNGVQISAALLADALVRGERVLAAANAAGALTLDALLGSFAPFDPRTHAARPHPGQGEIARQLSEWLAGSTLNPSHADCGEVQDAYSLRCIPQVHGAVLDALAWVRQRLLIEMNSATDNPLVFAEGNAVISGGNFHGAPIGYAADLLAIVLADLGSMSERRTDRLLNDNTNRKLPDFLCREPGVESGFMLPHVTAAALVSENKVLAHPASVDSITTSAGTEDHVSMATHAARKAAAIVSNLECIIAVELLAGCAALEFRRPLRTGSRLEAKLRVLRESVAPGDGDRCMSGEIERAAEAIRNGLFVS